MNMAHSDEAKYDIFEYGSFDKNAKCVDCFVIFFTNLCSFFCHLNSKT